jgi:hypothetical protein
LKSNKVYWAAVVAHFLSGTLTVRSALLPGTDIGNLVYDEDAYGRASTFAVYHPDTYPLPATISGAAAIAEVPLLGVTVG